MRLPLILLPLLACLTACEQTTFSANGAVSSGSDPLYTFRSTPQGCSRDPLDGAAPADTNTILTFLWEDPSVRDPLRDRHRATAPDAPLRLELVRRDRAFAASLSTVRVPGTFLDPHNCTTLNVQTREVPPAIPEGRPSLAGHLQLDCRASTPGLPERRISASITFQRCEY